MSIIYEERSSDSPYVETITRGWTESDGSTIRPAEVHWHMVFARHNGRIQPLVVGPWTSAGVASWAEGAEILWIKFKLGTFMPHLPPRDFLDVERILPGAARQSFWLGTLHHVIPRSVATRNPWSLGGQVQLVWSQAAVFPPGTA